MSRGPGRVERETLRFLTNFGAVARSLGDAAVPGLTVEQVAATAFGTDDKKPTRAQVESVRRACKRLATRGAVSLTSENGRLCVRLADSLRTADLPHASDLR